MTIGNKIKILVSIILILSIAVIVAIFSSETLFNKSISTWRKYMTPQFEVYGDENLLKDMKITMKIVRQKATEKQGYSDCSEKMETLLYNGKHFNVDIEHAWYYKIYFSYKDTNVGVFKFEDKLIDGDSFHHIYVDSNSKNISVKYNGSSIQNSNIEFYDFVDGAYGALALPIKDFFDKHKLIKENLQGKLIHRFFDFYDPKKAQYKIIDCDLETIF